ncbi:N-acetylmuramoyl-L-alanine amidase family protein [Paenibacillus abyssi]|nr:N-acetylmuramoyl-L-alanine amidase family protein [Paenibacillus abyssi]
MKKVVSLLLTLSVLLALWPNASYAATAVPVPVPKLFLDGKSLVSDVNPLLRNNYTLVPISTIAKGLGHQAQWFPQTRTVNVHNGTTTVVLKINDNKALINDAEVEMDAPAIIVSGRTMVPLRFVGEQMGLDLFWDNPSKSVHMYQKAPPKVEDDVSVDSGSGSSPGEGGDAGTVIPGDVPTVVDPILNVAARPVPTDAAGIVKDIVYDGTSKVTINYEGTITPKNAFTLKNTDRIVLDLPYSAFAPEFVKGFELDNNGVRKTEGRMLAANHPSLYNVRYSYFSDKPTTVRVVLDLSTASTFTVTQSEGQIQIDVAKPDPANIPLTDKNGNKIYKIVIDAGHGAKDPGAISVSKKTEKEFNLSIALKMKALLDKEPRIKPYLTRSDDTFLELKDRAKYANDLKADLFMSIHANSFTPQTTGTETYYSRSDSKAFADVIHKHLVKATGLPDRKVKQANFLVIRQTTMPAVLIEAGFLSNTRDEQVLFSEAAQNRIAAELVAGIKAYLKL